MNIVVIAVHNEFTFVILVTQYRIIVDLNLLIKRNVIVVVSHAKIIE